MVADSHALPGLSPGRLPLRPAWLGLIVAGGSVGTAARAWLDVTFTPAAGQWPWVTFWINIGGAFLLGALLELLTGTGPDHGWRRGVRLGLGTGLLGGFTTYSTLANQTFQLLSTGHALIGVGYGVGTVVAGLAAALGAIRAMHWLMQRRRGGGT
ncbi:MAG: CrcB family protein [Propionicimonas sp.]